MKLVLIAFALLFISTPVLADPEPRCPCYHTLQVAGTCASADETEYDPDTNGGDLHERLLCQTAKGGSGDLRIWNFTVGAGSNWSYCRAYKDEYPSGRFTQVAEELLLDSQQIEACRTALCEANNILNDDSAECAL
ncbi:MAG: hypothetical protein OQJ84_03995 [Xanthomonadales bacterium]|nr:hypothetical protein [Xanthomonadales bacterium]